MVKSLALAAVAVTMLAAPVAASAAVLPFSGSMTGLGVAGPDASCAPLPFRGTISPSSTVGTSSLGDFTYSHNICLGGADAPSYGSFIIDFGIDEFQGALDGGATSTPTPGISDVAWTYTILGGAGLTDARTRPSHVALSFIGNINAPAVPEPATWGLMILGFSGIGVAMHRRRQQKLAQLA